MRTGYGLGLTAIAEFARILPDRCPAMSRTFTDVARTLTGIVSDTSRILPGICPDDAPDTARTMTANSPEYERMIQRTLRRMLHRMLRGQSTGCWAEVARRLGGMLPYLLRRGWCLTEMTGFQISKSRHESRSSERNK